MTTKTEVAAEVPEGIALSLSLHEKITLISGEAAPEVTGATQQNKPAYSIGDIESAIRPLCAKYKVTTRWSSLTLDSYEQATRDGSMRMWVTRLRCIVTDAESGESFEDEWADIGTNPMAAASFCRKGYFKSLFHLAEEHDDAANQTGAAGGGGAATSRPSSAPQTPARAQGRPTPQAGNLCPDCAALGWKSKNGYAPKFWPNDRGGPDQCDGISEVDGKRIYHRKEVQPRLTGVGAAVEALFADGTPIPEGPDS